MGCNGIVNFMLMFMGVIDELLEWLLFFDFLVILVFVYFYMFFMVVLIFNIMMWIDKFFIEVVVDNGVFGF